MTAPDTTKVGYCTVDHLKILALFMNSPIKHGGFARLWVWATGENDRLLPHQPEMLVALNDLADTFSRALFSVCLENPLRDGATIEYAVMSGSQDVLEEAGPPAANVRHRFHLLPADGPLRVALTSCNHITDKGAKGSQIEERLRMWTALGDEIEQEEIDLILHMGDQIYADEAVGITKEHHPSTWPYASMDSPAAAQTRVGYYDMYVKGWRRPPVRRALQACQSVMMWDDHDIIDGWGSQSENFHDQHRMFFTIGRQCFEELQASTNPASMNEASFGCGFVNNGVGFLVLDGRSNRNWHAKTVLGESQMQAIKQWLESSETTDVHSLIVVSGVPIAFPTSKFAEKFATGGQDDIRDSWFATNNRDQCQQLLDLLFAFKAARNAQVVVVSGDSHVGSLGTIRAQPDA
nr:alkaline phosphatase family protein [Lujinxingiaceae bacterium]